MKAARSPVRSRMIHSYLSPECFQKGASRRHLPRAGPPEADLNTQPPPADGLFVRETDEEAIEESPMGDVPYASCVRLTMELLVDFGNASVVRSAVVRSGGRNVVSDGKKAR
ncbi:hypothetical protein V500_09453 [Pseudogymnoascus sp. VKM F-4518 (FW-2643)]|nr:hypothetical protein V500_09453 [Pseudogymnoascus sp. VKM F-4518 (FW-2643)]